MTKLRFSPILYPLIQSRAQELTLRRRDSKSVGSLGATANGSSKEDVWVQEGQVDAIFQCKADGRRQELVNDGYYIVPLEGG